jgi:hypothetical protein
VRFDNNRRFRTSISYQDNRLKYIHVKCSETFKILGLCAVHES